MKAPRFPSAFAGVLSALRFSRSSDPACVVSEAEWEEIIGLCDRMHLTLLVGRHCTEIPERIRQRIETNRKCNGERALRLRALLTEILGALEANRIPHLVLKGVSHWDGYVEDPLLRVQYDIDLFSPSDSVIGARDTLRELGYEPVAGLENLPTDHLPVMIRKTSWRWRGDYFDPGIPVAVELHFRFWDEGTEQILAPDTADFWERRSERRIEGMQLPVLHPADDLGYTSLHLLRHLLRGSLRVYDVYELAYFLHTHAEDSCFWNTWRELHSPSFRMLQAVCFRLAEEWFGCRLAAVAQEEIEELPPLVQLWFKEYGDAPLEALFRPNKHELWLHLSLLASGRDWRKVVVRRLFPVRVPPLREAAHTPGEHAASKYAKYAAYVLKRTTHHAKALLTTLPEGIAWLWKSRGLGKPFVIFLAAASLFNFGMFVFVLLYNLYLLDLGFQEDFLGLIASAMTAGSIAGSLPAGWLGQRFGLRNTLLVCFVGTGLVSAGRVVVGGKALLLSSAFCGGAFTAIFAVAMAPVIAQLTTERNRPLGFSLFFVLGIGLGILGGLVGGRLPGLVQHSGVASTPAAAKQIAMLFGCGLAALAAWPVSRLRLPAEGPAPRMVYPFNPFLKRFLLVVIIWNLATGSFNPFFNAYFSRFVGASVERIGTVFSGGQMAQIGAMLVAPLVLKRLGLIKGIMSMQLATGMALVGLAAGPVAAAAALTYAAYMAFQWMSEPGIYTLLMNNVRAQERSGASALNFLVVFSSQAVAAATAGAAFTHFGYPAVLAAAAAMAAVSAFFVRVLLPRFESSGSLD